MTDIIIFADWVFDSFKSFVSAFASGSWTYLGYFILSVFVVNRVVNFIKRFFR